MWLAASFHADSLNKGLTQMFQPTPNLGLEDDDNGDDPQLITIDSHETMLSEVSTDELHQ